MCREAYDIINHKREQTMFNRKNSGNKLYLDTIIDGLDQGIKNSKQKNNSILGRFRNTDFSNKHIVIREKLLTEIKHIDQTFTENPKERLLQAFQIASEESAALHREQTIKDLRTLSLKDKFGTLFTINSFYFHDYEGKMMNFHCTSPNSFGATYAGQLSFNNLGGTIGTDQHLYLEDLLAKITKCKCLEKSSPRRSWFFSSWSSNLKQAEESGKSQSAFEFNK